MIARGKIFKIEFLVWSLFLIMLLSACVGQKGNCTHAPLLQDLRASNTGSTDIFGMIVYFPGLYPEAEVAIHHFVDLAAGQTSAYLEAPTGVYAYVAYAYTLMVAKSFSL